MLTSRFFFSLENFWNRFPLYRNHRHILWKRVSYNPFLYTQIHSESLTRNWYGLRLKCGVVKFDMVMIGCISTWCDLGYIGSDEVDFRILQWKSISTYRELWKFDTTDKRDFIVAELSLIWNTFSFFFPLSIHTDVVVECIMDFCGFENVFGPKHTEAGNSKLISHKTWNEMLYMVRVKKVCQQ